MLIQIINYYCYWFDIFVLFKCVRDCKGCVYMFINLNMHDTSNINCEFIKFKFSVFLVLFI